MKRAVWRWDFVGESKWVWPVWVRDFIKERNALPEGLGVERG
jgi:hypothetical protein